MDLQRMFETQNVLRDRIAYNESDRFEKLILALLVEIGECANEWRGFKFWSKDQKPRTGKSRVKLEDFGETTIEFYNPLLEEYVDGLHFVLELGLQLEVKEIKIEVIKKDNITDQFNGLYNVASTLAAGFTSTYDALVSTYIGLGEILGFTWEEIESAYYSKNEINHQRQDEGY